MLNEYGSIVDIAFLIQEYINIPTFHPQLQLSQEKIHPSFHNVEEIHVQLERDLTLFVGGTNGGRTG